MPADVDPLTQDSHHVDLITFRFEEPHARSDPEPSIPSTDFVDRHAIARALPEPRGRHAARE
jgi:hypothetical protein